MKTVVAAYDKDPKYEWNRLVKDPYHSLEFLDKKFDEFLKTGTALISRCLCHFFRANEIKKLAESNGLKTIAMAGSHGLSSNLWEATNSIGKDKKKWDRRKKVILEKSTEPSVVEMCKHI